MSSRLRTVKTVLWAIVGAWAAVTVARFLRGLGPTTNLSDAVPWGLWTALDVMAGVALAAGGFVLAATVYVFGLERYRPFVRPAILTAFLGYVAMVVGLLYDLGQPWHIWHPIIYPQVRSVLFEVAMCVILYLAVLILEFAPTVLEHPWFDRAVFRTVLRLLKKITILLVIAGIVLSTLHQSSLGSLFLIAPHRLHPLWYSPMIYVLFFVSAVGLGLMTVTMESLVAGWLFGHKVRTELLSGLGLAGSIVLALYAVLRLGDVAVRGRLGLAFDGSWLGFLFLFEVLICAILPAALLAVRRIRSSIGGLAVCSAMVIAGMVLNRLSVCLLAFERPEGVTYFPTWMEFTITLGIVAAAMLAFLFLVEHLKVYSDAEKEEAPARRLPPVSYDPATLHRLTPESVAAPRRYSLVALTTAALAVVFLPEDVIFGPQPLPEPIHPPRTVEGYRIRRARGQAPQFALATAATKPTDAGRLQPLMMIDGNRNGRLVFFTHQNHIEECG
ncbi:MAG: Ni/Fe-hydrogenase cytochrome b subunit, partial [Candidatus Sumerlaeia bacterium]|nr:Ni/Fe-hydrogenase cytochrome b subunit [Candidatus Sumerlaeia bacterium]